MTELEQSGFIKHVINTWNNPNLFRVSAVFLGMIIATSPTADYWDDLVFLSKILEFKGDL